jgi:hypothetical protein
MLTASGTVKDDFLILGEVRKFGPELGEGNGSVQLQVPELLFTVIGADEQSFSRPLLLKGFSGAMRSALAISRSILTVVVSCN